MDFGRNVWTIAGVPVTAWATQVFEGVPADEAVYRLWVAILETARSAGEDPQQEWETHNAAFEKNKRFLNDNAFDHLHYHSKNGTDLTSVAAVHFEPLGIYAGKSESLEDIPDGAVIAVPNDTTNEARALLLLEANGLIKLKEGVGLEATPIDIEENEHNITFSELEAAQTARVIDEVDFAVVNGNYAIDANIKDRLIVSEDPESEAAKTYANTIVVKTGNEETLKTKALVAAVISDQIRDFMEESYDGAVVPVF